MLFTDPPYGIDVVGGGGVAFGKVGGCGVAFGKVGGCKIVDSKTYLKIKGDDTTDTARLAISAARDFYKEAIIWGGNYFTDFLPPSRCWIVWDKENSGNFADCELAWTSLEKSARLFAWLWNGMSRKGVRSDEGLTRVHPTQKPVGLFVEIFNQFEFLSCLDLFLGSGSTLIACEKTNRGCFGMEFEPQYCDVIIKRWEDFTGQKAELIEE